MHQPMCFDSFSTPGMSKISTPTRLGRWVGLLISLHSQLTPSWSFSSQHPGSDKRGLQQPLIPGNQARYNFGPASSRDTVLFTAERPGNPQGRFDKVEDCKVYEWIDFMKDKQISRVVALLDDNELQPYEPTGLLSMYRQWGLQCIAQSMSDPDAPQSILRYVEEAESRQERVVTHCTGGIGRCGRVAAAWLVHRYRLTPEKATDEVLQQALMSGVKRKGDVAQLEQWLGA